MDNVHFGRAFGPGCRDVFLVTFVMISVGNVGVVTIALSLWLSIDTILFLVVGLI